MRALRATSSLVCRVVLPISVLSLAACSSGGEGGSPGYSAIPNTAGAQVVADGDCSAAREVAAALTAINPSDSTGLTALPDSIKALHDVVPDELKSEIDLLGDTIGSFVGVLERFDFDAAKVEADASAKAELDALDTPDVRTAVADLQRWLDDSCA
jgi:hypothetical protein